MSELDEAWAAALRDAEQKARLAGRRDIAEYLALKNSNDLLRQAGLDWLLDSFTTHAGQANRAGASIQISNLASHRFKVANSTMVGKLLTLTSGVRTLYVEAGWPRVPRDGIVRGGGLACANIRHLGIKAVSEELRLLKSNTGTPAWSITSKRGKRSLLEADVRQHIEILIDRQ
ncbi:MAG TPA: hypothetical protein VLA93_22470 [Pyrinomonadaceae bacterium]|nr:hypothetical protein [Pyrinomonadaceae bacterium]